ncbi:MAG: 2-amino-4-hydroxy-6-hydroxymethyldihydropteridine diphosphokinase [Caulobacteraceae bacterium]
MTRSDDPSWLDDAAVIGLGSNLAGEYRSSAALLEAAVKRLADLGLAIRARSSWWRSSAWPDPSDPPFLNGVALAATDLPPHAALDLLHRVEREFGRRRGVNAPRTLDLDLIAHGRQRIDADGLVLPHPRAQERRFVMGPLAEIAPGWRHPVSGETASALAARATVGADARATGNAALHKRARNAI